MPHKRANGEGTRPYLRKDGRYQINYSYRDLDGAPKRGSVLAKTAAECREKHRAALGALDEERRRWRYHGLTPDQYQYLSVERYFTDWLDWVEEHREYGTWRRYTSAVTHHITPDLGRLDLAYVTPGHIEDWLARKKRQKLSGAARRGLFVCLSAGYRRAVKLGLVERNPCRYVEGAPQAERRPDVTWTPAEARRFIAAAERHHLGALFTVALALGLRHAEALGLTWGDVDAERGVIRVRRQLQRRVGEGPVLKPLKNRRERVVPLPEPLAARLERHRAVMATWPEGREGRHRCFTWRGNDWGLVFVAVNGRPLHQEAVMEQFREVLAAAGLPASRRFHDLRHACATLLHHQGVGDRLIMEILGHSAIAITMNLYTHVIPSASREALEGMAQLLEEGGSDG